MAWSGRSVYDTGVWDGDAEDVSDMISLISPFETKLLDRLGDAPFPAQRVLHEWLEEELNPNTITTSTAIASHATTAAVVGIFNAGMTGVGNYFHEGCIFKNVATGEYHQATSIGANTMTLSRAFGGSSAASAADGIGLFHVSDASLEGRDVAKDISQPRARKTNYTQVFMKDVIVSGSVQATTHLGNITDEFDHQSQMRMREIVRDLEKATINGKTSGDTIGSATAYRTMKGVWDFITTNSTQLTGAGSLNVAILNSQIEAAWDNGATDLDLIVASAGLKKVIDGWNDSRIQVDNADTQFRQRVTYFDSTFGEMPVVLNRWMPDNSLMILSTQRVKVVPLQGRSFFFEPVAKTGDATKGYVLGEYTVEVKNEKGLAKIYT